MGKKIGELLISEGLLTAQQLNDALEQQRQNSERIGAILIRRGLIEEETLLEFLSRQFQLPTVDPARLEIGKQVQELVPRNIVTKYQVVPFGVVGSVLHLALSDPGNLFVIDDVRFISRKNVRVHVATESSIRQVIEDLYERPDEHLEEVMDLIRDEIDVDVLDSRDDLELGQLETAAGQAPVVKLVNILLMDAIRKGASDIHLEPYEKSLRVRFRIDGVLYEMMRPPIQLKNAITSRIKIMSHLDIAERRLPQDGRIKLKAKGREMDFRVSVLPTLYGEKVVLRLLDRSNLQLDMARLGFDERQMKAFREAIYSPYGMILVTGPTGSGKTTTLYSALSELNRTHTNISTAEDPVEYSMSGINQVQVHEAIGLNFAAALRSFLRQDPDIIMVGEIRDFETAEVAIKAALTGHLVLSTVHTNDAPSTVNRLLNMGVEPFLVSSALNLVIAQRLARRVCGECRVREEVTAELLIEMGVAEDDAASVVCFRGRGCPACNNTGYRGRVALYEVLNMTDEIRELVLVGASAAEIKQQAARLGMRTLRLSGIDKLKQGVTSVEEVMRCTMKDAG
ncbi:MAG: type IV-A pilus assembly ATPase PilB [Syntrophobacteraceae bacterium CG2_30_61_12]|nr:MAG: type IV-A pilus assembly ATPase PilB [Syntrophobacteraceae bacterium CG2_30_61_12]